MGRGRGVGLKPRDWSLGLEQSLSLMMIESRSRPAPPPLPGEDIALALRKPLWIGAFLGVIPIQGLSSPEQRFVWLSWRTVLSLLLTVLIGFNVVLIGRRFVNVLTDTERESAGELVGVASGAWFYGAGTAVYVFFLLRSAKLSQYLERWRRTSEEIRSTMDPDTSLTAHVNWAALLVLGSCFGENIMFHFYSMSPDQLARIQTLTLEELLHNYYSFNGYMYSWFDYHPLLSLALLLLNKLALYAWNFGDLFLVIMARCLMGRFEGLNRYLERGMILEDGILLIRPGWACWRSVRVNWLSVLGLLEGANRLLGPLIWLSCSTDIFFVSNQLYIELSPSGPPQSLLSSVYVIWSFLHLFMRTLAVNLSAAGVNEAAHRLSHILQHVHPRDYNTDVRRLELYLGSGVIGLTGNGCFVITRSFILMITSAIFTLEVVLLQNTALPKNE